METPQVGRRKAHMSPAVALSPLTVSNLPGSVPVENDDIAEKKARRRSRIMELQQMAITDSPAAGDRRASLNPLSSLSNVQISEHYSNCLKLSAENKINAKNAFTLHLIDHMMDLIKKKKFDNNFQVASSTLDASTKIYAGRVDAVHADTYKVLGGLGHGKKTNQEENGDDADKTTDGLPDDAEAPTQRKKRKKRSTTVENNLKNITLERFDWEDECDPLFHVMSATFDEGGTAGLLLNHLRLLNDDCELVLDPGTVMDGGSGALLDSQKPGYSTRPVQLSPEATDCLTQTSDRDLKIMAEFQDFEFMNWNREMDESVLHQSQDAHRFDVDAEPEQLVNEQENFDNGNGLPLCGDDDDDVDDEGADQGSEILQSALSDLRSGKVSNLVHVISSAPSDYSYFDENLLKRFAAPGHWKMAYTKALARGAASKENKKQKKNFKINFDLDDKELESMFKQKKAVTTLSRATFQKYINNKPLCDDYMLQPFDISSLFKLITKPSVTLKGGKQSTTDADDCVENFDFDNDRDREAFCPDIPDDDDEDVGLLADGPDCSQNAATQQPHDITGFTGDNLLQQPYKVAKMDIAYAKTAKKVDVKHLKRTMWTLLEKVRQAANDVDAAQDQAAKDDGNERVQAETFQELLEHLPDKLVGPTARNLSVPIAFVCALHLANEKELKFEGNEDFSDFIISHDE